VGESSVKSSGISALLSQLDAAPLTKLHRRLVLAAGLGVFLDGYDLVIIGVAMIFIRQQWHPSAVQDSMLGSAALAGAFLGALLAGHIADRFGRKAIYVIDLMTFFAAAVMCALAWNFTALIVFRLLLGLGVGADYPLSATYLAEFAPKKSRGSAITLMFGLWSIGAITAGFTGLALWNAGVWNWRLMLGLGALPAILVIWLRRNLPESPRWYLRRGNTSAAAAVIRQLNPTIPNTLIEQAVAQELHRTTAPAPPWTVLFSPALIRATLLSCLPWFIMDLVGYYLTIYQPTILGHLGFVGIWQRILGSTILNFSFLLGFVPLVLLVDRIGRITPQIIGFCGSGLCLIIIGGIASAAAANGGKFTPTMVVTAFASLLFSTACNSFGPGNTTYMIPAEVYPTSVRATGHGFATSFSRFGAVVSTFFLPLLEQVIPKPLFFGLLGMLSLAAAWITWQFRIDSRRRPLAQDADDEHYQHPLDR
jgi:putative MFS transporter